MATAGGSFGEAIRKDRFSAAQGRKNNKTLDHESEIAQLIAFLAGRGFGEIGRPQFRARAIPAKMSPFPATKIPWRDVDD
jgi:hypothetical protein